MGLSITAVTNALVSHAQSLGLFEQVNTHEPRGTTTHGLRAAVWVQGVRPAARRSGVNATSAVVLLQLRIYQAAEMEPRDAIDQRVTDAMDVIIATLTGDFELGGAASELDLLGMYGQPMEVVAGYVEAGGGLTRIMDLTIPVVVNDAWLQGA